MGSLQEKHAVIQELGLERASAPLVRCAPVNGRLQHIASQITRSDHDVAGVQLVLQEVVGHGHLVAVPDVCGRSMWTTNIERWESDVWGKVTWTPLPTERDALMAESQTTWDFVPFLKLAFPEHRGLWVDRWFSLQNVFVDWPELRGNVFSFDGQRCYVRESRLGHLSPEFGDWCAAFYDLYFE